MDSKGLEIQGLNMVIREQPIDVNRETSYIKPVEKITQDMMGSVMQKKPQPDQLKTEANKKKISEDDAETASEIMNFLLEDSPELEADWKLDKERSIFLVMIKNKNNGQVIRQIPAEEILMGINMADFEKKTGLLNKTV